MTCSILLSSALPVVLALVGPAPAEGATADASEGPAPSEGDAPSDLGVEPLEAGPPGPAPDLDEPSDASPVEEPMAPAAAVPVEPVENPITAPPAPTPIPPPPARPIRWRLDLGVGGGGAVVGDLGYRAFSYNRNLLELSASSIFDFRLAEGRVFLGGGLAYQRASRSGDAYGSQLGADLRLHEPEVLGRVSVMTFEGLDAFGLVGVGPSFARVNAYSEQSATQRAVLPRVDGWGGLSLYLPKKLLPRRQASRITAGLQLAVGYTWRGTMEVQPVLDQGDDPLRATTSPWGDLSLHGFSWRAGLFVRLM